jgi:transposase InsO family protein
MHLTLKLEATKPAAQNFPQQQARLDDFIDGYNNKRPHQALNMQCPAQRYQPRHGRIAACRTSTRATLVKKPLADIIADNLRG